VQQEGLEADPDQRADVREALAAGRLPDPRVMRESTARILIDAMRK